MKEDIWVNAYEWEDFYEVSDAGRVRSKVREGKTTLGFRKYGGKILQPVKKTNGYLAVNFTRKGARRQVAIHRLVLSSFVEPSPSGMEACHNDGDRENNRLENLRWDTRKENHADKKKHGTWQGGEKSGTSKLTDDLVRYIRASSESHETLANEIGVHKSCIEKVRYGETWRHVK